MECFYCYCHWVFVETHKSLLMEFVQKTKIAAPIFKRDNEGSDHAPQFRCTVFVGGKTFTPGETFPRLRDAEHEASKLALGYLAKHPPTVRLLRTCKSSNFLGFVSFFCV